MDHSDSAVALQAPTGWVLAPVDGSAQGAPLRICVLARKETDNPSPLALLRELPGARVYLGAVCDADARIQEWVEVWVQTLELRDLAFSGYQERLTNFVFDQRWAAEYELDKANLPGAVITTGLETNNPGPILIKRLSGNEANGFAPVEPTAWRICKDDALLDRSGLPAYSTSPFRYLHEPASAATEAKMFLATAVDAPTNSHVQGLNRLNEQSGVRTVFNPHAGLIRVMRFSPLGLEDYLQVLEGRAWEGAAPGLERLFERGVYAQLKEWSASPKGMPFLLHGWGNPAEKLNEVFFLKLSALRNLFQEVRSYVKARQLPLLNLSPASFNVRAAEVGDPFPALWAAKVALVKPGQAHPLKIKTTDHKYFIRLGAVEPSPFLPESVGAHSFGIGSVRLRNVLLESDGIVLEGTLVGEEYLRLDPHDLLWFKLPIAEARVEFYAHVYTSEAVGPKEARFRTVPARLPDEIVAKLKPAAGSAFPRSPYEVWPLLSSPCDLYSLGILAIRILLANSKSNLPVIVDEVLSLARHLGKDPAKADALLSELSSLFEREKKWLDLVGPHALVEHDWKPGQAWSCVHQKLWLETIALLLRLFPGAGAQSYCKDFGDVSPLALETVFDRPLQELDALVLRLRSTLTPSLTANEEIAGVLLAQLALG